MKLSKLFLVRLFVCIMLFSISLQHVVSQDYGVLKGKRILYTYGGYTGHEPVQCKDIFVPWLESVGAIVILSDSLNIYKDSVIMNSIDLIIQSWTQGETAPQVRYPRAMPGQPPPATPAEPTIVPAHIDGQAMSALIRAVQVRGVGLAGWHGGTGDAFRNNVNFQYMVGGQWVQHPGNVIPYEVSITNPNDPVTKGLSPKFNMRSEQYYMHVDPNVKVLATTKYNGDINAWIDGAIMPVVWKKYHGNGRVFYSSLGHVAKDFEVPEALEIMKRGICWAVQSLHEPKESWMSPVYPY